MLCRCPRRRREQWHLLFGLIFSGSWAGRCLRWVGLATFPGALDSFSAIFSRLHTSQPASSLCFDKRQSLWRCSVGRLEGEKLAADPAGQAGAGCFGQALCGRIFVILRCMFTLYSQFMVLMLTAGSLGQRLLHSIISLKGPGCSQTVS